MDKKPAKVTLILITIALFLCGTTFPVAALTVAHWKFEEGPVGSIATSAILDSSGNNQSGTPIGGPIYQGVTNPNSNLGLKFDGVDDRIFIPDNPIFQLTDQFTIEAFIRIDAFTFPSGYHDIIVSRDLGMIGIDPYVLTIWNPGYLLFAIADQDGNYEHLFSPSTLNLNQTYHVAGTFESKTMKLYIDGQLVASTTTELIPADHVDNPDFTPGIGIGNTAYPVYNHSFNGVIDEVRISNVALSPSEFLNVNPVPELSCKGFEPPMNNGPVKVKKNRVLPLKAQLEDADGLLITGVDITSPPVLQVLKENIEGVPPIIDVTDQSLSAGKGTEGNQFYFDYSGKWQFNLMTKGYSGPGTYHVFMDTGDHTEYVIAPMCEATFVIE